MNFTTSLAALGVAAALLGASAASATTIHFNEGRHWSTDAHTYGSGSNTVSVEAFRYNPSKSTLSGNPHLASWSGNNGGLGICSDLGRHGCKESHQIDGSGRDEIAVLDFGSRIVQLTHVTFARAYATVNEKFDLFVFGNGTGAAATRSAFNRKIGNCSSSGCTVNVSSLGFEGSLFGIGAQNSHSFFKVKAISFKDVPPPEVIPLPAAGWLLLGGLGGLAALKRRRKAA